MCESNVRASQMLTSRRNIFVVEKLGDSLPAQIHCGGAIGSDQWNLDTIGSSAVACVNRCETRNGHGRPLRKTRAPFQHNHSAINSPRNVHVFIVDNWPPADK